MNSSLPEIHLSRIGCWGRYVWFRSSVQKPSEEELAGWIARYREDALTHDPGERLIVDVERDGLRRVLCLHQSVTPNPEIREVGLTVPHLSFAPAATER